jgi:hypothetical protein
VYTKEITKSEHDFFTLSTPKKSVHVFTHFQFLKKITRFPSRTQCPFRNELDRNPPFEVYEKLSGAINFARFAALQANYKISQPTQKFVHKKAIQAMP